MNFLWPDAGLIVEVDGVAVHKTSLAFHQDRRRDRELAAHGYLVVRVTELDLEDPAALAAEMTRLRETRRADSMGRLGAA